MASFWELLDPSNLVYYSVLGHQRPDSGAGPPANFNGWIRTGIEANDDFVLPSPPNCNAWQDPGPAARGTTGELTWDPEDRPWKLRSVACGEVVATPRVWCVEDL